MTGPVVDCSVTADDGVVKWSSMVEEARKRLAEATTGDPTMYTLLTKFFSDELRQVSQRFYALDGG